MDKDKYKKLHNEMAQKVIIPTEADFNLSNQDLIFTFDIQYQDEIGFVAVDIQTYAGELKGIFTFKLKCSIPYQSGYFSFREGPLLQSALESVIKKHKLQPSLFILDGHGTAHPRKLGVASWLGVKTGIPSIGVAKMPLLKTKFKGLLAPETGSTVDVLLEDELVGYVLRSQTDVKPIFVSAGHKISQSEALRIAMQLRSDYRILEPIRRADKAAREASKEGI